jgi:alkylhydroperoxidase/carboxymuconolactone decarboxylase family protein YurZ
MSRPTKAWARLKAEYPDVAAAYEALAGAARAAGPLDEPTVALLKVAVSIGRGSWRTVHAHAKKALAAGVAPAALRQAALIALPTVGLPAALDALRWVDESIEEVAAETDSPPAGSAGPAG